VLIRGFDPFNDTVEFGGELIPRIKAGAVEVDRSLSQHAGRGSGVRGLFG